MLFKCPNALCSSTSHVFAFFVFPVLFGWAYSGTLSVQLSGGWLKQLLLMPLQTNGGQCGESGRGGGWNRRRWKHEQVTRWIWSRFMSLSREFLVYCLLEYYLLPFNIWFYINTCYIFSANKFYGLHRCDIMSHLRKTVLQFDAKYEKISGN